MNHDTPVYVFLSASVFSLVGTIKNLHGKGLWKLKTWSVSHVLGSLSLCVLDDNGRSFSLLSHREKLQCRKSTLKKIRNILYRSNVIIKRLQIFGEQF